jgi:hypothetical protein
MAQPDDAARLTGYVLGGISPLGQKRRLAAVVDASVSAHDSVFVSGGRRGLEIELAPHDLVQLTDAAVHCCDHIGALFSGEQSACAVDVQARFAGDGDQDLVLAEPRLDPGALLVAEIDGVVVGTLAAWDGWRVTCTASSCPITDATASRPRSRRQGRPACARWAAGA